MIILNLQETICFIFSQTVSTVGDSYRNLASLIRNLPTPIATYRHLLQLTDTYCNLLLTIISENFEPKLTQIISLRYLKPFLIKLIKMDPN